MAKNIERCYWYIPPPDGDDDPNCGRCGAPGMKNWYCCNGKKEREGRLSKCYVVGESQAWRNILSGRDLPPWGLGNGKGGWYEGKTKDGRA